MTSPLRSPQVQQHLDDLSTINIMRLAGPMLLLLVFIEAVVSIIKKSRHLRLNDSLNSISHGLIERVWIRLTYKTFEFGFYCYVYAHYAFWHPQETTLLHSILTLLAVDFGYYCFHRVVHESNLLWSAHVVHHSSEEFNLSTAVRQSVMQVYVAWIFYLPMALIIPPKLFYLHQQLNSIYQFWLHTKLVGKLGPLEWVFNTPSHHRVHHGRNPKYLDKNYGGILIIWDRIFGTFQAEEEEPIYGLVHPLKTWSIPFAQFNHLQYVCQRVFQMEGFWNKWAVIWKGPGWRPSAPRLGFPSDIPEIDPHYQKYDPYVPQWLSLYILFHFTLITSISIAITLCQLESLWFLNVSFLCYFVFSLCHFCSLFEYDGAALYIEIVRLAIYLIAESLCLTFTGNGWVFLWYTDPSGTISPNHPAILFVRATYWCSIILLIAGKLMVPTKKDVDI